MCWRTVPSRPGRNVELSITRDGKTATVEVDITLSDLSQKEVERIREVMGDDWSRASPSNKLAGAMVWAKLLHTPFADVTYEEIDFDLSELAAFAVTPDEKAWVTPPDSTQTVGTDAVVIPMEPADTTTGTDPDAEVTLGGE